MGVARSLERGAKGEERKLGRSEAESVEFGAKGKNRMGHGFSQIYADKAAFFLSAKLKSYRSIHVIRVHPCPIKRF